MYVYSSYTWMMFLLLIKRIIQFQFQIYTVIFFCKRLSYSVLDFCGCNVRPFAFKLTWKYNRGSKGCEMTKKRTSGKIPKQRHHCCSCQAAFIHSYKDSWKVKDFLSACYNLLVFQLCDASQIFSFCILALKVPSGAGWASLTKIPLFLFKHEQLSHLTQS